MRLVKYKPYIIYDHQKDLFTIMPALILGLKNKTLGVLWGFWYVGVIIR
jgi:hypothetical protein